jgi:uncharacterized protein (TIGR00369 family)
VSGPDARGAMPGFDHSPFMRFLGLEMIRAEKGVVEIRLPFREEFLRNDGSDWLHGGVVSALADIAGDYAVITETAPGVPTIDMRIDYLRPARRGDLLATGRTVRVGKTVSVADVEIRDSTGTLVAVGRACYASPRPREETP